MPFFQKKKIIRFVRIQFFFLALFIISGCIAQKTEPVKTTETEQPASSKEVPVPSGDSRMITRQIDEIQFSQTDQAIQIQIQGNQKLVYTSIKQSFPFGVAVYLPETKIDEGFQVPVVENSSIGDLVVAYADLEKTTAKVEILLKRKRELLKTGFWHKLFMNLKRFLQWLKDLFSRS